MPRLRVHPLKSPPGARLAREGQMELSGYFVGTPYEHHGFSPRYPAPPGWRPYVWRERERHPVLSPAASRAFASGEVT